MRVGRLAGAALLWLLGAGSALATSDFSCGGFAMLGGAQLVCSHTNPSAPAQFCTFSWALMGSSGQSIADGSFMLLPGIQNATVYQGSGYTGELSNPIVLCQASKAGR